MKCLKYENEKLTIDNIQSLEKSGFITEIIFDADNKIANINIKEEKYIEVQKAFKQLADNSESITNAICEIGKKMLNTFNEIFKDIKLLLNKKITKKRFIKLLQSNGIQRNDINKIIKNNNEQYTYSRYYETARKFQR